MSAPEKKTCQKWKQFLTVAGAHRVRSISGFFNGASAPALLQLYPRHAAHEFLFPCHGAWGESA
jgi:hypothetical protein